ncbi:LysR substrate-binding domain-containing protein [Thalassolituus sp. LLYu03]|uniref:LysR family transcriptional regulator n=1 Tax=Thalassolituus sp. LLYu03 TaxID=3421656 RepID=UPI003D28A176
MSYQTLPLLHVFHQVAAHGSFQGAANELSLPRSSVSKKIRQLEEVIGQPLLKRSTRQLQLTEVGQNLLSGTHGLSQVIAGFSGLLDDAQTEARGKVKISASVLTGQVLLIPLLSELRRRYPLIELELSLTDRNVDLLAEKVDIAIRIGQLPDSSLIARKIGDKRWGWFASPEYLAAHGAPQHPHQLKDHHCLVFRDFRFWSFVDDDGQTQTLEVTPAITTDDSRALVDMAAAGLGIIMVDPRFGISERAAGRLLPVMTGWRHPDTSPVNLLCVGERSRAAQAVWEFLLSELTAFAGD